MKKYLKDVITHSPCFLEVVVEDFEVVEVIVPKAVEERPMECEW